MSQTVSVVLPKASVRAVYTWTFPTSFSSIYSIVHIADSGAARIGTFTVGSCTLDFKNTSDSYANTIKFVTAIAIGKA